MAKVKQLLTEQGCVVCDTLYPEARAALGYVTCMPCGEAMAKNITAKQHTILPSSSIYEIYKLNPPIKDGQRYRGNSSAEEYWRGFDNHRSLSPSKSSVSYQAYKAGSDAREMAKQINPKHN